MKINFKSILKTAGKLVLGEVPGGNAALALINTVLPDDKKLDDTTTGTQAEAVIKTLPAPEQAALLSKELDVEIEEIRGWTSIQASLAAADSSGSSTRPAIALMMARVVGYAVIVFVALWAVAVLRDAVATLDSIKESWPWMLAVLGTPTALLRAYFGMRTKEKTTRYNVASGQTAAGGIVGGMIKAFTGRR